MRVLAGRRIYLYAVCFLVGAVAVQQLPRLPPTWELWCLVPVILAGARFRRLIPVSLLLAGSAWAVFRADMLLEQSLPRALEGEDIRVEGVITSLVHRSERYLKFTLDDGTGRIEAIAFNWADRVAPGWRESPLDAALRLARNASIRARFCSPSTDSRTDAKVATSAATPTGT